MSDQGIALDGDVRGTSNRGTGREDLEQARDAQLAALAEISTVATALNMAKLTGDEIGAVLDHAANQVRRFESAPGPLTAQAFANDLLEAFRVLRDYERQAPRGTKGELLKTVHPTGTAARLLPWTRTLPRRLEEVTADDGVRPLFGNTDVQHWMAAVSYRPPPAAGGGRRQKPPAHTSEPVDSTSVKAFEFVQGSGKTLRRQPVPWPLPKLIVPNSYRIDFIKGPGMSFRTREGRIKVLAFILEEIAVLNDAGDVYSSDKEMFIPPAELAAFIVETASIGYGNLLFEGPQSAFQAFERAPVPYATDFVITDEMIQILRYFTDIKPKFRWKDKADTPRGCGSIEWITELFKDVPHYRKEMWIQDKMMSDKQRVVYPGNYQVGDTVPAQFFLTKKVAESLGDRKHMVVFVGSFTANDRIIKTEDGRLWLVKEYERNLASFCQAVIELQGILTLSFIFVSAIGAVLGGPLVGFLLTAGDIAIDINEAGGIRQFVKELKSHPLKAAWFMFNLALTYLDVKGMKALWMNPREALGEIIHRSELAAMTGRAPPTAGGAALDRGVGAEQRLLADAKAGGKEALAADGNRGLAGKEAESAQAGAEAQVAERPAGGRPTIESRGARRPTEPAQPKAETAGSRPREQPETEVPLTDAAKARKAEQVAEDAAAEGRRRPRPAPGGRVRNRRPSKAPKGQGGRPGTRSTKKGVPGRTELTPSLRGAGRRLGGISKEELAEARAVKKLIGENAAAQRAAERLELLECEALTKSIAEAHPKADELEHARDLLVAVAKLADDEIQGLGIIQRVLEEAGSGPRNWFDVFFDFGNTHTRSDLLRLVKRVDPVIETGFPELLARTLQGGPTSFGAGLGHLHAIAHLEEAYRAFGVVFRLEERAHIRQYARQGRKIVEAEERALREIDIVAVLNDGRQIDNEVKTYTEGIEIFQSVRYQIVKDLLEHLDRIPAGTKDLKDLWQDVRYLFPDVQAVRGQLATVKEAILRGFTNYKVQRALVARGIDDVQAKAALVRRLDDVATPMVDLFPFSIF